MTEVAEDSTLRNDLRNQFYFYDRASQTSNPLIRQRGVATEPPPTTDFNDSLCQWAIYDAYMQEQDEQKRNKPKVTDEELLDQKAKQPDLMYGESMKRTLKVMERLTNQNSEAEVFADYKYWEDQADQYRDGDGVLLPLWRFACDRARRKQVTSLKWNPRYPDLFAVGYGSFDFLKQSSGLVCCFSIKNTRFPEFVLQSESGVCSLDWHPSEPALLVVGLYDGGVAVYDVRSKNKKPLYQCSGRAAKHTDPVWGVRWLTEEPLAFTSASSDGAVHTWRLMKTRLEGEVTMELAAGDGTALAGLASALCFDFKGDSLFAIGTEEGMIYRCSRASTLGYLGVHKGHGMAVYSVKWNPFHEKVFISASADWTVRLWHEDYPEALAIFELGQAVGDVSWAPYSSTVFAAITADGFVHFYDLNVNRQDRILHQKVTKKSKLTQIAFNRSEPVVLVGDERGSTTSLKLSPNLRVVGTEVGKAKENVERSKMTRVVELILSGEAGSQHQ